MYHLISEGELDGVTTAAPINFGLFTLCVGLAIPLVIMFAAQVFGRESERSVFLMALVGPLALVTVLGSVFFFAKWREDNGVRDRAVDRIKKSGHRLEHTGDMTGG